METSKEKLQDAVKQEEVWPSGEAEGVSWRRKLSWDCSTDPLLKMSQSYVTFCVLKKNPKTAFLRSQKSNPHLQKSQPEIIKNLGLVGIRLVS